MWQDFYDARAAKLESNTKSIATDLKKVSKKIDAFLDRIVSTDSPTVINAYEDRIRDLEHQKLILTEKSRMKHEPQQSFEGSFRTAMNFLANPWKLWASERFHDRRLALKLVFSAPLAYCRETGFRTAKTTFLFNALADLEYPERAMAEEVSAIRHTPLFR